uniref:Uncharacterized protein n=1 Tax=Anopheles albimanus TaxID=7167 RepID=A0A182FUL9_ANOAL
MDAPMQPLVDRRPSASMMRWGPIAANRRVPEVLLPTARQGLNRFQPKVVAVVRL